MKSRRITLFAVALIVAIWGVNAVAVHLNLYYHIWWFDIPMHILGGFWIALFGLITYYHSSLVERKDRSAFFVVAFALATTMCIGLLWELFEFGVDRSIALSDNDLADTLGDFVNDMIGASFATAFFLWRGYNKII
jgi:xanthine/uracil permease